MTKPRTCFPVYRRNLTDQSFLCGWVRTVAWRKEGLPISHLKEGILMKRRMICFSILLISLC